MGLTGKVSLLKAGIPALFEEESKERCPDCSQPLTFVRTKSHERRWYCYSCEKYIDDFAEAASTKELSARLDALSGLQVIDSHGVILGRVRKAIPNEKGDIKAHNTEPDYADFVYFLNHKTRLVGRIRLHRRYHSDRANSMSFIHAIRQFGVAYSP